MTERENSEQQEQLKKIILNLKRLGLLTILILMLSISLISYFEYQKEIVSDPVSGNPSENVLFNKEVKNGIHLQSGLIAAEGYELVFKNCGGCHSHALVVQNRADAEGWKEIIRWMQASHNLWDLGESELKIIEYLSTNYGPTTAGRRNNLGELEWYLYD